MGIERMEGMVVDEEDDDMAGELIVEKFSGLLDVIEDLALYHMRLDRNADSPKMGAA
jgi:hypothetical protein